MKRTNGKRGAGWRGPGVERLGQADGGGGMRRVGWARQEGGSGGREIPLRGFELATDGALVYGDTPVILR
jgi:hypothetical protein